MKKLLFLLLLPLLILTGCATTKFPDYVCDHEYKCEQESIKDLIGSGITYSGHILCEYNERLICKPSK